MRINRLVGLALAARPSYGRFEIAAFARRALWVKIFGERGRHCATNPGGARSMSVRRPGGERQPYHAARPITNEISRHLRPHRDLPLRRHILLDLGEDGVDLVVGQRALARTEDEAEGQ